MTGSIEYGAKQAVENCTRVQPGEKVVIITDNDQKHIGHELRKSAELITPGNVYFFNMDNYGARPDDGSNPLKFPSELENALKNADVSFYTAGSRKGELKSFRIPMLEVVENNSRLRHAHMPGITDQLMCEGMSVDYRKVQKVSADVLRLVSSAQFIQVTSPLGTNLVAEFSPDYNWCADTGLIKAESWSNLPGGEVFTCAYDANGTVVIDGVLGDYFDEMFGLLSNNPLTLQVENGRIKEATCNNDLLLKEFKQYIKQDENADRIGEFAIGTNIGLTKLVGNLLQDEKFPGVHIAVGSGYPDRTGSGWDSEAHLDGVMKNVTVDVEGKIIMKDGNFVY